MEKTYFGFVNQKEITILVCIDWFYPAYKAGGPVISIVNLINQFNSGVKYKVLCSDTDLNDESLLNIERNRWVKYNDHTDVFYWSAEKKSISFFMKINKEIKPDIIFINGIYSPYLNLVPIIFGRAKRMILSTRGMMHPGALKIKSLKKLFYLKLLKSLRLNSRFIYHATNDEEKEIIVNVMGKSAKVIVAVNFPRRIQLNEFPLKTPGELKLVTIALIGPMKNHVQVLKALRNVDGLITYNIYGPIKEPTYWEDCLEEIKLLPSNINVNYCGDAEPYKVPQLLSENQVYIQPSVSENFGHSLYEALSAGKPVITSMRTPWNNLEESKAGKNVDPLDIYALSDTIDFFCKMDDSTFTFWCQSAKQYAEVSVNFKEIELQYKNLFELYER